jgi:ABC-type transport system involved in multi-copper enzyme maturation permease subunit
VRAAGLIAVNFLREQRWVLVVLVSSVVVLSSLASWDAPRNAIDDVLYFLKQQAMYGVAFAVFLASAAIHNDRRSRRILSVLSKGIERRDYLAGLLLGVWSASFIYCIAMSLAGVVVFPRARVPQPSSWIIIVALLIACMLTSALALFFATLMPPLLAALAAALALGAMSAAVNMAPDVGIGCPIFHLLKTIVDFSPSTRLRWSTELPYMVVALVEAVVLWAASAKIFGLRDVAVPVE